jgi:hypothetical protein
MEPMEVDLRDPPNNFWTSEPIVMKLGMYIMLPEIISTAYLVNPSHH